MFSINAKIHLLHVILLVHLLLGLAADHKSLARHLIANVGRKRDVLDDDGCDLDTLIGDAALSRPGGGAEEEQSRQTDSVPYRGSFAVRMRKWTKSLQTKP